ncbi:hypothetical protein [Biformimicrobium ophioploci]|uniref:Tetratricopeptide repeat protein n=1 Tax=Biformimicrobium ophioploci TaxID=3036711 RepID=A0ABQ6LYM2_9GAMM|nr:hypothetical protein [Microbulbifer sp. NKW57]GMG87198.1 hypothetical protein MNKW57_15190 [Microbulbifer sp. NKW57]
MYWQIREKILAPLFLAALTALPAMPAAGATDAIDQVPVNQLPASPLSADQLAAQGEYEQALLAYETALSAATDAESPSLRFQYGKLLMHIGLGARPEMLPLARQQFARMLADEQDDKILRGRALSALAHSYHQQALQLSTESVEFRQLTRRANGLYLDAREELISGSDWHNLSITCYNLGQLAEWRGDLSAAVDFLEQAVALDREHGFTDLAEDLAYLNDLKSQLQTEIRSSTTAL